MMASTKQKRRRRAREQGFVSLMLFISLGLIALLVFAGQFSADSLAQSRKKRTVAALAKAKEALLAYAVLYPDQHSGQVPGYLPCPDNPIYGGTEGNAASGCSSKNITVIGRFPWKTLGVEPPRDGSGECLWYIVSGTFKNNSKTDTMNWDTLGQIEVLGPDDGSVIAGATTHSRAAAVIIAPGDALTGQDRTPSGSTTPICGGNYTAAQYLDSYTLTQSATTSSGTIAAGTTINNATVNATASAVTSLIAAPNRSGGQFNDQLLAVSPSDIFDAVTRRNDFQNQIKSITNKMAVCLAAYGNRNSNVTDKRLPWAGAIPLNDYDNLDNYYDQKFVSGYSGRFPYYIQKSTTTSMGNTFGASSHTIPSVGPAWLLLLDNSYTGCVWTTSDDTWYKNWKDQFFYALGRDFSPEPVYATPPTSCHTQCLTVNGAGLYAAVILFSGRRIMAQSRSVNGISGDKSQSSSYMEGRNATNHPNSGGNSNYETRVSASDFNDILYCIDPNMVVTACP